MPLCRAASSCARLRTSTIKCGVRSAECGIEDPSPALTGPLSPSDGEREGVRGRASFALSAPIQASRSGVLRLHRFGWERWASSSRAASRRRRFNKWKDEGRPWSAPRTLDAEQRNRYHRHLLLPEVGEAGQQKLLESKGLLLGR